MMRFGRRMRLAAERNAERGETAGSEGAGKGWAFCVLLLSAAVLPSVGQAQEVTGMLVRSPDGSDELRERLASRQLWTPEVRASFAECFAQTESRFGFAHPEPVAWTVVLDAEGWVVHSRQRSGSRSIARCLEGRLSQLRFAAGTPGRGGLVMVPTGSGGPMVLSTAITELQGRVTVNVRGPVNVQSPGMPDSAELQGRLRRELAQHRRGLRRCARGSARMALMVRSRRVSVDASQPREHRRAANCFARVLRRLPMVRAGELDGWGVYLTSPPDGLATAEGIAQASLFLQHLGLSAAELELRLQQELQGRRAELAACLPPGSEAGFLVEAGRVRVDANRTLEARREAAECALPLLEDLPALRAAFAGPWAFSLTVAPSFSEVLSEQESD